MSLGFKHYLIYFFENFKISFKSLIEFKTNLYNLILIELFLAIAFVSFSFIFSENFGDIIGWNFIDFLLLYYIVQLANDISGFFVYNKGLSYKLKEGSLNTYLSKPGNVFLNYILGFSFNTIIPVTIYSLIVTFLLFYIKITLFSLFILVLFFIFLLVILVLWYHFLSSFAFYFLKLGEVLLSIFYFSISDMAQSYPFQFFSKLKIKLFLLLIPTFIVSSIIIPILRGSEIYNLKLQILFFIIFFLISFFGLIINWKIGLKKYEAFG